MDLNSSCVIGVTEFDNNNTYIIMAALGAFMIGQRCCVLNWLEKMLKRKSVVLLTRWAPVKERKAESLA